MVAGVAADADGTGLGASALAPPLADVEDPVPVVRGDVDAVGLGGVLGLQEMAHDRPLRVPGVRPEPALQIAVDGAHVPGKAPALAGAVVLVGRLVDHENRASGGELRQVLHRAHHDPREPHDREVALDAVVGGDPHDSRVVEELPDLLVQRPVERPVVDRVVDQADLEAGPAEGPDLLGAGRGTAAGEHEVRDDDDVEGELAAGNPVVGLVPVGEDRGRGEAVLGRFAFVRGEGAQALDRLGRPARVEARAPQVELCGLRLGEPLRAGGPQGPLREAAAAADQSAQRGASAAQ
jgi:hypothetical protein